MNGHTSFIFWTCVAWSEVIGNNSGSETLPSHNNGINANNNFVITGSESYGIASVYLSFDFDENWISDIDTNTYVGADDSSEARSTHFGYIS